MKLLLEDTWQFRPDLAKSKITESKVAGGTTTRRSRRIPGTLAEADVEGGNGRIYPRNVWEANLKEGSALRKKISEGAAWGLLEHPKDGIVDLSSPIAFQLVDVTITESGKLEGTIEIYEDLPEGHKLSVLIDNGWVPKVSSRGMGSIIKNSAGKDIVDVDYVCEGWDAVATPSFTNAVLRPDKLTSAEALATTQFPAVGRVSESATECPKEAAPKAVRKDPLMNMTQVRESLPSLRSFVPSKATPAQIAEGFARITECHRALSAEAANAQNAWDCSRLHEELNGITSDWTKQLDAPKEEVARLTESNKRLVTLTETAVKTVKQYRGQLTETNKKNHNMRKMLEALVGKVRGWKTVCETREGKAAKLQAQVDLCTEALDIMAAKYKALAASNKKLVESYTVATEALDLFTEQYHSDTAKLAKSVISLKNPDAVKDAKISEALVSAKTLKQVIAVKESIKRSKTAVIEEKKVEAHKAPIIESKVPTVEVQTSSATGRSTVTVESIQVIKPMAASINTLNESIALVRRQSESQKVKA